MKKKKYYIIGIGGVAMANLASLLKAKGYEVLGSDQKTIYEPMRSFLKKQNIKVLTPYSPSHVKRTDADMIIIGNAIGRGNVELEYVLSNGLSYRSLTDTLREEFLEGKKPIVIAGTHGKTTTSALMAWILECAGLDPTLFIGGFTGNFKSGSKLGKGPYVVLEGDEYNSSFFDRNPKILGYRPYIGLLNNIELDHIDIYKNLDEIKSAFKAFLKLIPANGLAVVNTQDRNSANVLHETDKTVWKENYKPRVAQFHVKRGQYSSRNMHYTNIGMTFDVYKGDKRYISDVSTSLIGLFNVSNILGCVAIADFLKVRKELIRSAIGSYAGVKRRLEPIYEKNQILILDDYAHHPTAVNETLMALRMKFHMKRIVLFFEPGSASSKQRIFEDQYIKAFMKSNVLFLYKPYATGAMKSGSVFHGKQVVGLLNKKGVESYYYESVDKMLFHAKQFLRAGDVGIVMSCRGFDGFREKLTTELG